MQSHEDPEGVCHEKHSQRGSLLMHEDWDEFFISHTVMNWCFEDKCWKHIRPSVKKCTDEFFISPPLMFDVLTLMLKESVQKLPRRNMEVMSWKTYPKGEFVDAWKIGQSFSYCQNSRSDRVRSCVYGQSFSHWQNNWVIVCEHREEERISGRVLKQYAKQIKSTASASNCYNSRLTVDCRVTWVTRQDLWKQSS